MFFGAGCDTAVESPVATAERARVSGSGTCLPLLRILTDAYKGDDVEFAYLPGLHSGGGIRGVENGDLELGAVSRELTVDEAQLGLEFVQVSDDGLAIAVHPSVEIDGLTTEQVRSIYSGVYDNWSELGGNDLPIVILDRSEDESAKIILREYVLGDMEISEKAINLYYEPDMVSGLQSTPGAIGYFSLGLGISEEIPVRFVSLDGVSPSLAHIKDGSYPVIRPLGIVYGNPVSSELEGFIRWIQGDEAARVMEQNGFSPVLSDK